MTPDQTKAFFKWLAAATPEQLLEFDDDHPDVLALVRDKLDRDPLVGRDAEETLADMLAHYDSAQSAQMSKDKPWVHVYAIGAHCIANDLLVPEPIKSRLAQKLDDLAAADVKGQKAPPEKDDRDELVSMLIGMIMLSDTCKRGMACDTLIEEINQEYESDGGRNGNRNGIGEGPSAGFHDLLRACFPMHDVESRAGRMALYKRLGLLTVNVDGLKKREGRWRVPIERQKKAEAAQLQRDLDYRRPIRLAERIAGGESPDEVTRTLEKEERKIRSRRG